MGTRSFSRLPERHRANAVPESRHAMGVAGPCRQCGLRYAVSGHENVVSFVWFAVDGRSMLILGLAKFLVEIPVLTDGACDASDNDDRYEC